MIPLNPMFAYIAAGALAVGGLAGYKVRDWQCDAAVAKAYAKAEKKRQELQNEVDQAGRDYEAYRAETDGLRSSNATTIERIYREIPAPALNCAAPAGIVGLLQSSVDSANANASGKPSPTLPASK